VNKFALLDPVKQKERLDSYLIDHWSISAVASFIANEKAFERKYIFKDYDRQSSLASIIGSVYHKSVAEYFRNYKENGVQLSFDALSFFAYTQLNQYGADQYKPQKTKTIIEQQQAALESVNKLLHNFLAEVDVYLEDIQEIVWVECKLLEYVTINGVDIPLPLKATPDLVYINKRGELCILDHKSKRTYTPENRVQLKYSNQSCGYVLAVNVAIKREKELIAKYPKIKEGVKHFYFYENKYTKNKDGSNQIKRVDPDIEGGIQMYEQILFESVWRIIGAVQDPDYVYLMNPNDHFEDSEKTIDFWIKTHIEGLEGFPNLKPNQIKILKSKRKSIRRAALTGIPKSMVQSFRRPKNFVSLTPEDMENLSIEEKIEHRLMTFSYPVKVEHVVRGYSCDTYLLQVAAGAKINKIYGYRMDIANVIGVPDVRISPDLVRYKGGAYVSVEVNKANTKPLKMTAADIPDGLSFPLGKDNFGGLHCWSIDNPSTPHLMIAGASGSGKSVAIKAIIKVAKAKGVDVAILDPKYEFMDYKKAGYEVINELEDIEYFMEYKVLEMDEIFRKHGASGNSKNKQLIIFDESADCFTRQNKERVRWEEGPGS